MILFRKTLRDMKNNIGQFMGVFFLSFLAVSMFACMKASNISAYKCLDRLFSTTNTADGWVFGESFSKDDVKKIDALDGVEDAQGRLHFQANAIDNDSAQLQVYLIDENDISKPYIIEGSEVDLDDDSCIWITKNFADAWDIKVGDDFTLTYNKMNITRKVAGLTISPEYQYLKADSDADVVHKNIAVVYMSKKTKELENLPYNEIAFAAPKENVKGMEDIITKALSGNYSVLCDRNDLPGMKVFADELSQHDQFSYLFTLIFLLIALLVIMTTMNRIVTNQRTIIGTLCALGMKRRKIIWHYLSYGFVSSLAGSIIGLFVGTYGLGRLMAVTFKEWYAVPGWDVDYNYTFILAIIVVVLCCMGVTYLTCRKMLRISPAVALKPAAPKKMKKNIFDRFPLFHKLGFMIQYDIRDIARNKLRASMAFFGCAAGMMIMVAAFASFSTMKGVSKWYFDKIQNYKYEIDFDNDVTQEFANELKDKYEGEFVQLKAIEVAAKEGAPADDRNVTSIMVTEGLDYVRLTDTNLNTASINEGEIAITYKLAKKMGLKVNDEVYWHVYEKNTWHKSVIGLINRNPMYTGITILRDDYEKTKEEFVPSALYTDTEITKDIVDEYEEVVAVHDDADLKNTLDEIMSMMYVMVGMFMVFSVAMTVVVLYCCGNISFEERQNELATLRVLGFTNKKVRKIIGIQNIIVSLPGVIIGAPLGKLLLQYMFDSNGDSMDIPVTSTMLDYIISAVLILVISVMVSFMFNRKIRNLDMVECMKDIS